MKFSPIVLVPLASVVFGSAAVAWSILAPINTSPLAQRPVPRISVPIAKEPQLSLEDFAQVWHKQLFTPPAPAPIEQPQVTAVSPIAETPRPTLELTLNAILYSDQVRMAVFARNGTGGTVRMAEGDEQSGLRVERIYSDYVDAVFAGEPITIKLNK